MNCLKGEKLQLYISAIIRHTYCITSKAPSYLSFEESSIGESKSKSSSLYISRNETWTVNSTCCFVSSSNKLLNVRGIIPDRGSCGQENIYTAHITLKQTCAHTFKMLVLGRTYNTPLLLLTILCTQLLFSLFSKRLDSVEALTVKL